MSGDATGWKRGAGPYSRSYPKVSRATDYTARGIQAASFGDPSDTASDKDIVKMETYKSWQSASIKQGSSPPRYRPKSDAGTSPKIRAAGTSGKYAKRGGRGKGFGA